MKIIVRKNATKDIMKISEPIKSKIKEKILLLSDFPDVSNIKKLVNHNPAYRMRVGDYRVLFEVVDGIIEIVAIKHRKESYR